MNLIEFSKRHPERAASHIRAVKERWEVALEVEEPRAYWNNSYYSYDYKRYKR